MQTTNSDTRIGIVTRRSDSSSGESFIHVWSVTRPRHPTMEYKFPRWSKQYPELFRVGQFVKFEPTHSIDKVQEDTKIWLETDSKTLGKIESLLMPGCDPEFMMKTTIVFPPVGAGQYHNELDETRDLGCRAIAWSWEFGRVALMDDRFAYKPGLFYSVYATRIHPNKDWIAAKMGTLWVICTDTPLKEVTDPIMVARIHPNIPWKDYLVRNIVGNVGAPNSDAASQLQNLGASSSNTPSAIHRQQHIPSLNDDWSNDSNDDKKRPQQHTNGGLNMMKSDPEVATGGEKDEEAVLFGKLVGHKLAWINARSANAATHLQKTILDLCNEYKSKMLANSADPGTHRQQQQAPMSSNMALGLDKLLFG